MAYSMINSMAKSDVPDIYDIYDICKKYRIRHYTIREDAQGLLIDVDGDVDLFAHGFCKFPLRFGKVTGDFSCYNNKLTSLEGCPVEVGGSFYCWANDLSTLEFSPMTVGGYLRCRHNKLTSVSFDYLFDLGYNVDKIICEDEFDLVVLKRQWFLNSLIND